LPDEAVVWAFEPAAVGFEFVVEEIVVGAWRCGDVGGVFGRLRRLGGFGERAGAGGFGFAEPEGAFAFEEFFFGGEFSFGGGEFGFGGFALETSFGEGEFGFALGEGVALGGEFFRGGALRGGWWGSGRGWLGGGGGRGFSAAGEGEGERGEGGQRGFHGKRQGGAGDETRGACRIFNWMGSELSVEGHGEDFHGVEGFGGVWFGAEVETDLGETADVAHGDEVGGGGGDVVGLEGAEGGGGFGFVDVVGAGAAAAGIAVGDFAESDVRDLAEEGARGAADALGVAEVAGVVVGDAERAGGRGDGREAEAEEVGRDVFDFGGEG
jgi:hypothetical protein